MKRKLLLLAAFVASALGMRAQTDAPFLKEKTVFGGTAVSQLSTFVPGTGTTYTLELTGCVSGQEITVPGGSFSYTPTANGTVRFVRNGGDVVYVYEGTTYKGTVSISTPADPTYPTVTSGSSDNLIQNGGFEDTSAGTYASGRYKPTHWTPYNKDKGTPDNGVSVRSGNELTGSYNMLMHAAGYYLTQQLASGVMKNFTPYQISFEYKANADGQKGTKYRFDVGSEEFKSDYFQSDESSASTTSKQTFTKKFTTPAVIVNQPYVQLFSTTNKGSGATQKLDRFDEFILVAANGGGIGITGATGASFLSGLAFAPEGAFSAATSHSLASPYVTSLVTNGTFESNTSGWTTTTETDCNSKSGYPYSQQGAFTGKFCENWSGSNFTGKTYQSVSDIPNGTYKLNICAFAFSVDASKGQYVYAGSNKSYIYSAIPTAYTVYAYVSDHSLEYGIQQDNNVNSWIGIDNVSLEYCGPDDVTTDGFKAIYDAIYDDATNHLADGDYANVTGGEKTNLQTAVNATPTATIDGYATATFNIGYADDVFTAAKSEYDRYVAEKGNADRIATSIASEIAAPTTAAGCDAVINSILVAEYNYVSNTSNFNAKQAEAYGLAMGDWTFSGTYNNGGTADTRGSNSNEHWSGTTVTYYEQGTNGWGNGNWVANYNKTVTLPAGTYVLRLAARASTNTTATMKVTIGETSYTEALPSKGAAVKGITTAGVASFSDGTFANTTGRGWQWRYLPFTLAAGSSVRFDIDAAASPKNEWCSFGDVELYSNVNLTDLETALSSFTLNTIGFDKDEYAPYNNVEVLETYAKATAIHDGTQVPSTQAAVDALTAILNSPTWTQNDTEVNAIYDGSFAYDYSHDGNVKPTGWTGGAGHDNATDVRYMWDVTSNAGLDATTNKTALFTKYDAYYGKTTGYTMPLKGNTVYQLTFKYGTWGTGNDQTRGDAYVKMEDGNGNAISVYPSSLVLTTEQRGANADVSKWYTFTGYFTTAAAGDYVLDLLKTTTSQQNQYVYGDIELKKAVATDVTISELDAAAPAYSYSNVTLTRTLKGGQWNGFSVPFGFTVAGSALDGSAVKKFKSVTDNEIILENADEIVAGEPYLVKPTADVVNPTFNGVVVTAAADVVNGTGDYKFASHLYNTALAVDGSVAYVSTTDSSIKKLTSGSIKGLRAIFQIPTSASAKALVVDFGEGTTGILNVDKEGNIYEGQIYNLAGQRVNMTQKGIYIVNGKKVVIK